MTGGPGADTLSVDNASDQATGDSGTDTVESSVSTSLGAGVENGVLLGSANINLTGNALANTLTGNGG